MDLGQLTLDSHRMKAPLLDGVKLVYLRYCKQEHIKRVCGFHRSRCILNFMCTLERPIIQTTYRDVQILRSTEIYS